MVDDGGCWMVGAFNNDRKQLLALNVPAPTSAVGALLIAKCQTDQIRAKGSP